LIWPATLLLEGAANERCDFDAQTKPVDSIQFKSCGILLRHRTLSECAGQFDRGFSMV
jgi:hypothetical protein